eukprot:TRINITY_DN2778_c0_g1_i1.p1 TRINITY_DN2778_c0_g1~~TRINITY_DN2778_c0_g1_i1.p1  ORF type:complete len:367 (+),score=80.12 TRINITY_DN2778_c0_g1_i1:88-1188(+)
MIKSLVLFTFCFFCFCYSASIFNGKENIFPTARDPLKWPFANYSIWNLPIGKSATYVFADLERARSWGMTVDPDIIILDSTAPVTNVYFNSDGWSGKSRCQPEGGVIFSGPIPSSYVIPGASSSNTPNYAGAILLANGHTIVQGQPLTRCVAGGPATALVQYPSVDIYTDGIAGAHGGSGLSSIGGTLRLGELVPNGQPIRHALKINLDSVNYYRTYRWPASKADGCAPGCYTGKNPAVKMGSLLALNSSVDIDKMGFETEPGKMLAWTFQNYGSYIVDTTGWSVYALETEQSPAGDATEEFEKNWGFSMTPQSKNTPWGRDMDRIFLNLYVVDSWDSTVYQRVKASSGQEGAGGGAPRQPWAPSF